MGSQDELRLPLRETARAVAAEELQALAFLDREECIPENGECKNGTYPRRLETSFGLGERGLREVLVFVTDDPPGMEEAVRWVYPVA